MSVRRSWDSYAFFCSKNILVVTLGLYIDVLFSSLTNNNKDLWALTFM